MVSCTTTINIDDIGCLLSWRRRCAGVHNANTNYRLFKKQYDSQLCSNVTGAITGLEGLSICQRCLP